MVTLNEMQDIKKDYIKRYLVIISKNGICKKSNEYQARIERLEKMIENYPM